MALEPRRGKLFVKIIGDEKGEPVPWSLDNGLTSSVFHPGEVHQVPDYVAWGMERRKWAEIISDEEMKKIVPVKQIETQDAAKTEISMSELRKPETKKGKE